MGNKQSGCQGKIDIHTDNALIDSSSLGTLARLNLHWIPQADTTFDFFVETPRVLWLQSTSSSTAYRY